jgi:GH24 family phage-related lysozyme (muramidase)
MSVEIDLSGGNIPGLPKKMEIKNAAQEETLKEILKLMQQQQKLSEKLLKVSEKGAAANNATGGSAVPTGKAAKANEQAQQGAAKAANNNSKAMLKTGISLGVMTAAVVRNASALNTLAISSADLVKAFSQVGDSITGAAGELGKIPFVGGLLQASLGATADAADRVYDSYRELAETGATFDGSMRSMVRAATGAGLTFDQFAKLLAKNSDSLRLLGGTTEAGAKRFSELSKSMRASGLDEGLLKMGYSTEEINNGMASYIGIMGRTGKAQSVQNLSTEQLTQQSATYLKELDALAKITGQTRSEKQKEFDDLSRDAQFRAATLHLSEAERMEMMSFVNSFPKEAQGAVKDMISTGTASTDAAKKFAAMNSQSASQIMRFGAEMGRGGKISKDRLDQNFKDSVLEARANEARYKDQARFDTGYRETQFALSQLGRMDVDGKKKALTEQEKIAEQTETLATDIGKLKQNISESSNKFAVELLNDQALDSLKTAFTAMSDFVMAFVVPVFKLTVAIISPFVKVIGGVISIISKTLGPVLNIFAEIIGGISSAITTVLTPAFDSVAWVAENVLAPVIVGLAAGFAILKIATFAKTAAIIAETMWTKTLTGLKKIYGLRLVALSTAQTVATTALGLFRAGLGVAGGAIATLGTNIAAFGAKAAIAAKGLMASGAIAAGFAKVAAVFMGALAFVGKGIALAGAVIASPAIAIGAAIAAAAAAVYMVVKHWDTIVGFISNIGAKLKNGFLGVLDSIKSTAKKLNPLNWFSDDEDDKQKSNDRDQAMYNSQPNESSAETARLSRQNTEISPEMQRSLKLAEMYSEGEDDSEAIEVGEKQLAAANRLTQGIGKLDQTNKLLNETLIESNELDEDAKKAKEAIPQAKGQPKSSTQAGPSPGTASGDREKATREGSVSESSKAARAKAAKVTGKTAPSASSGSSSGSSPGSPSQSSGGGKAPSAGSGGKDGASASRSNSGGQDGGVDGGGGGGGGGAKPQATGKPSGKGGTMSEQDIKAMVIDHEGIRYEPYKDSVGLWTVGVGHLIGDGKTLPPEYNRKFSHEEVMSMFEKDYEKHKKQAQSNVPGFGKFDSLGQAALIDLTFNMGPGWPRKFKNTSAKLGAGDTEGAAEGLTNSKWYGQVGRRAPKIVGMIRESKVSAAEGGVFNGPKSGYPATLHGEEAVVPLKGGNIPVEMGGNASQAEMVNLLSELNSHMAQLVSINAAIADLNSSQLKAQKKMGNKELLV